MFIHYDEALGQFAILELDVLQGIGHPLPII